MWEADVTCYVWIADAATGRAIAGRAYNLNGVSDRSRADALSSAFLLANFKMSRFVEDAFPLEGKVVALCEEKKGKAESVYIDLGTASGLKAKQKLDVTVVTDVAGVATPRTIGSLTAREVTESRTLCAVSDGAEAIALGLQRGVAMTVRTRARRTPGQSIHAIIGTDRISMQDTPLSPDEIRDVAEGRTQAAATGTATTGTQTAAVGGLTSKKVGEYRTFGKVYDICFAKDGATRAVRIGVEYHNKIFGLEWALIATGEMLPPFVEALKKCCDKYGQWMAIAKANNVSKLDKEMPDITVTASVYHKSSDAKPYFETMSVHPKVFTNGKGEMVATISYSSKCPEALDMTNLAFISFNSVDEFKAFAAALDIADMERRYDSNQSVDDLFK